LMVWLMRAATPTGVTARDRDATDADTPGAAD
jgi:hypothetical protein